MIEPSERRPESRPSAPAAERSTRSRLTSIVALVIGITVLSGAVAAGVTVGLLRLQSRASTPDVGQLLPFSDESTIVGASQKVLPSVASVVVDVNGRPEAAGSAFVYRGDGYLVTNTQVVAGATGLSVVLPRESRRRDARIVDFDCATGVAVLKVDQVSGLPALGFGDSGALRSGQTVLAASGPLQGGGAVSRGVVGSLHRGATVSDPLTAGRSLDYSDTVGSDVRVDAGGAGGPLVSTGGQVVAILLGAGAQAQPVAIGSVDAAPSVDQIVSTGQLLVPSLDATVSDLAPEAAALRGSTPGGLIRDLRAGGVAALAGLRAGDVVTQLDDVKVDSAHPVQQVLRTRFKPSQRVTLTYSRGGASTQVQVTLRAEHPSC